MSKNHILVIGAANITRTITTPHKNYMCGNKFFLPSNCFFEFPGGGGFNVTYRLLRLGLNVIPIFPIANDEKGLLIKKTLLPFYKNQVYDIENRLLINNKSAHTPSSTIITNEDISNVYIELQNISDELFIRQFNKNKSFIKDNSKLAFIGHLHIDNSYGTITTGIIDFLFFNNIPIYINWGITQIKLGYSFWKNYLEKIFCIQFNIDELLLFINNEKYNSIQEVLSLFIKHCNIIITFGEIGVIIQQKNNENFKLLTSKNIVNVKNGIGKGDAFSSAILFKLFENLKLDISTEILNWAYVYVKKSFIKEYPSTSDIKKLEYMNFEKEENNQILNYINDKFIKMRKK